MSYTIYYPGCASGVPDYVPDICDEEVEHGRVRSVAFVLKSYLPTLLVDPTLVSAWQDGIALKKIIIIPTVSGSFDGGSPVEVKGYGNVETKITGFKFSLTFKDPAYKKNTAFYNALRRSANYCVAWRTETTTRISDNEVQVIPKTPITEDLTDVVEFDVEVKFAQTDQPAPFATPAGIFEPEFQYV